MNPPSNSGSCEDQNHPAPLLTSFTSDGVPMNNFSAPGSMAFQSDPSSLLGRHIQPSSSFGNVSSFGQGTASSQSSNAIRTPMMPPFAAAAASYPSPNTQNTQSYNGASSFFVSNVQPILPNLSSLPQMSVMPSAAQVQQITERNFMNDLFRKVILIRFPKFVRFCKLYDVIVNTIGTRCS